MNIDIKTKNIDLTDAIREAVESKMVKVTNLIDRFGESVSAEVEVGKTTEHHAKGPHFRAEIRVRLPGKLIYTDSTLEDLYQAIREARDKAIRQIQDYKETLIDKAKDGVPDIGAEIPVKEDEGYIE